MLTGQIYFKRATFLFSFPKKSNLQTAKIALQAAQKAAAIDELTGMMNMKSFRSTVKHHIQGMEEDENGILIMIDGDHFKSVNDQ